MKERYLATNPHNKGTFLAQNKVIRSHYRKHSKPTGGRFKEKREYGRNESTVLHRTKLRTYLEIFRTTSHFIGLSCFWHWRVYTQKWAARIFCACILLGVSLNMDMKWDITNPTHIQVGKEKHTIYDYERTRCNCWYWIWWIKSRCQSRSNLIPNLMINRKRYKIVLNQYFAI